MALGSGRGEPGVSPWTAPRLDLGCGKSVLLSWAPQGFSLLAIFTSQGTEMPWGPRACSNSSETRPRLPPQSCPSTLTTDPHSLLPHADPSHSQCSWPASTFSWKLLDVTESWQGSQSRRDKPAETSRA